MNPIRLDLRTCEDRHLGQCISCSERPLCLASEDATTSQVPQSGNPFSSSDAVWPSLCRPCESNLSRNSGKHTFRKPDARNAQRTHRGIYVEAGRGGNLRRARARLRVRFAAENREFLLQSAALSFSRQGFHMSSIRACPVCAGCAVRRSQRKGLGRKDVLHTNSRPSLSLRGLLHTLLFGDATIRCASAGATLRISFKAAAHSSGTLNRHLQTGRISRAE
jgi:hypothetical protein